jgi:fluoroquinolone transport system permease protein
MENVWSSVFRADAKRIVRDRFLLLIVTYLPLMALAFRWAIPWLAEQVQDRVDLTQYYPVLCVILVLILPYIMGLVLGLQLLEEKDERTLAAVAVTPFSIGRYFWFRVWTYAVIGAVMLVISHAAMGLVGISRFQLSVIAVSSTISTGASAVIVAVLAKNQVQGFAVLKGAGLPFIVPALSFFVPRHWDLLFGVIPLYWPIKAYYVAVDGGSSTFFWAAIAAAIVTQAIALVLLYRLFKRRILQV